MSAENVKADNSSNGAEKVASRSNPANSLTVLRRAPAWLNFWVPLSASLLSVILAVTSLIVATEDPGVVAILPSRILMDDADLGADMPFHPQNIYMQPNFVGTGNNSRVELLRSLTLTLETEKGGPSATTRWSEQGRWDFIEGTIGAEGLTIPVRSYIYQADAAPLLVGPNNAQQPLCVFPVPQNFEIKADISYKVTLTVDRVVVERPLVTVGHFIMTSKQIAFFKEHYNNYKYIDTAVEAAER